MSRREEGSRLGEVVHAGTALRGPATPARARQVIVLLAVSVAIVMTGFGIVLPVFARRLGELDEGVGTLGLMTMAFALASSSLPRRSERSPTASVADR